MGSSLRPWVWSPGNHGRIDMAETTIERLNSVWACTDRIFDLLAPEGYLAQPIALRHPFIFYVGHLPAFAWNHVGGGVLGRPSLNPAFDELFSRGIDPDADDPTRCHAHPDVPDTWPTLPEVFAYRDRVRARPAGVVGDGVRARGAVS